VGKIKLLQVTRRARKGPLRGCNFFGGYRSPRRPRWPSSWRGACRRSAGLLQMEDEIAAMAS